MIEYLEHHIVDHCNLKCAGCSHFSGLAPEWFEDIEDFIRDFTQLQKITDGQVRTIRLMGGEPLLHPEVEKFLVEARKLFPKSEIQLVTNGLLLKKRKEELLDTINDNNIRVCVSNYGLLDLRELLKGIKSIRVDEKGQMYNISLDLEGGRPQFDSFRQCDLHIHRWYYFQGGRFYPCCIASNIWIFNKTFNTNLPTMEGYSVYEHTEDEIKNCLNQSIDLCAFCDTARRQRTYHPFSQSKGEISEWTCQ